MWNKIEKKCPYCGKNYYKNTIRVPGVYWGHYYDNNDQHEMKRPDPPCILYHFTPFCKLQDIFYPTSNPYALWAGHYSKMNDWKEVTTGIELLKRYLRNYKHTEDKVRLFDQTAEIQQQKKNCYIFSLTEEKDILSQWRAYTSPDVGGVALGFDTRKLKLNNIALVPCSYTNYNREIDLNNIFQMAKYRVSEKGIHANEMQKEKDKELIKFLLSRGGKESDVEYQLDDLIEVATTTKDYGFFEEKEWRLIVLNPDASYSTPENYFKIPFDPKTWIKEIVISPHGNKEDIIHYIYKLINNGILDTNCAISVSEIPYIYRRNEKKDNVLW